MKLIIKDKKLEDFKKALNILSAVSTEVNILFTPEGIVSIADHSGTTMCRLMLKKELFDVFEGEGHYGISTPELNSIVKDAKAQIEINTEDDKFNIMIGKDTYYLSIIEDIDMKTNFPSIDYGENKITTTFQELLDIANKSKKVATEDIKFIVENKQLLVSGTGFNKGAKLFFKDTIIPELEVKFFKSIMTPVFIKNPDEIELYLKSDTPLTIKYVLDNIQLEFVCAPLL